MTQETKTKIKYSVFGALVGFVLINSILWALELAGYVFVNF